MYLRELRYIFAIADEANITKAAERLYISQPSLSQFLSEYEKTLGFKLFFRSRTGAVPTPAGESFICAARNAVSQIDAAVSEITAKSTNSNNTIRIGIPDQRAVRLTSYLLPHVRNAYPDIDLEVIEGINRDLREMLTEGKIDLWLASSLSQKSPYPEFKHRVLCTEEILLAIPPGHRLMSNVRTHEKTGRTYLRIQDLQGYDFFLCSKERNLRLFSDRLFERYGLKVKIGHSSTNIATVLNGCLTFGALTFVSQDYTRLNTDLSYVAINHNGFFWYILLFTNRTRGFSSYEGIAKTIQSYFEGLHHHGLTGDESPSASSACIHV